MEQGGLQVSLLPITRAGRRQQELLVDGTQRLVNLGIAGSIPFAVVDAVPVQACRWHWTRGGRQCHRRGSDVELRRVPSSRSLVKNNQASTTHPLFMISTRAGHRQQELLVDDIQLLVILGVAESIPVVVVGGVPVQACRWHRTRDGAQCLRINLTSHRDPSSTLKQANTRGASRFGAPVRAGHRQQELTVESIPVVVVGGVPVQACRWHRTPWSRSYYSTALPTRTLAELGRDTSSQASSPPLSSLPVDYPASPWLLLLPALLR
ncbi:uncharacterized protein PHACADRAFT_186232 [Phanerochaete carnosa HHB-10118-sp]|uniref:Uncharacterized protein n=1 Tax=Phanerochaete carnosa (strain HHB-10118-sp) TaxID=650164 RepID=K5UUC9_PHACS|nr:uncharacterized protein PHACADRAFT_186232 [Phanerochaete carnosa HHB-10118-sp]EKM53606.1 hypothetical protein PHACADRAFT_186232 [Phanerochaete carnosa HHB-10118-sp]